jgi:prepilin-type processing-associated H-X9-DG protein
MSCGNNFKQLGLAMHNYHDAHKALPMGMNWNGAIIKGHSAFAALLPYLEEAMLYEGYDFKKRIYDPPNNQLGAAQPSVLLCPSDDAGGRKVLHSSFARSNSVVCFGSNKTGISGTDQPTDGAFGKDVSKRFKNFEDGTSTTALASEVLAGRDDNYLDDNKFDARGIWIEGTSMGACAYTHWNTPNSSVGDALFYSPGSQENCVAELDMPCDPSAGTSYYDEYASARSRHPGGVHVVFGDGHVNFSTDEIDSRIWQAQSTIAGGELIQSE